MMEDERNNAAFGADSNTESNSEPKPTRVFGVTLLILFVLCLLVLLWVIMIVTRFLLGLGG